MKQRVSLARAIVHDPPVLVLDEPAAGLDPRARVELRELLKVLADRGKAILISSHILTELAEICNGAVIIEQGKILRAGSLEQIIAHDSPLRTIVIRAAGSPEALHKELLQLPFVHDVRMLGEEVEIQVDGDDESNIAILTHLVGKGLSHHRLPPATNGPRRRFHDRNERGGAMSRLISLFAAAGDQVNPIVVKEFRQAVQSRLVIAVLILSLLINLVVVGGYVMFSPDADTSMQGGQTVFMALLTILHLTCLIFVPLYAGVRLSLERGDANIDLLFVTTITPGAIIRGKYLAAMALTLLIYRACLPFLTSLTCCAGSTCRRFFS